MKKKEERKKKAKKKGIHSMKIDIDDYLLCTIDVLNVFAVISRFVLFTYFFFFYKQPSVVQSVLIRLSHLFLNGANIFHRHWYGIGQLLEHMIVFLLLQLFILFQMLINCLFYCWYFIACSIPFFSSSFSCLCVSVCVRENIYLSKKVFFSN